MAYPMTSKSSASSTTSAVGAAKKSGGNTSWVKGLVTLIVILIIIGGGFYLVSTYTGIGSSLLSGTSVFKSDWQAVFLTNGQVYFGKVVKMNGNVVVLNDIYYLQVINQPLQRSQQATETAETAGQDQTEQRLTLVKLGNEIHGPQDEMMISREHIIIIEDLKDDSRVVQAIDDYVATQ